jgi:uncharacterized protein YaiE (UPF0345 family)
MSTLKTYNIDSGDVTNLTVKTNGTTALTINGSTQNVGIGTASPNGKLSVIGASSATLGSLAQFTSPGGQGFYFNSNSTGALNTLAVGTGENLAFNTGSSERMRIDSSGNLLFNSGYGSVATAYGCRAWVNFDGTTASPSTIRGSGNVTSVTKNATGKYTVNFTTAMPDANYCVQGTCEGQSDMGVTTYGMYVSQLYSTVPTSSAVAIATLQDNNTFADSRFVDVAIFR